VHTRSWWENPSEKEDLNVDGRMILKWIFKEMGVGAWIGFIWLRVGTRGGLF
jgi:hypothetical protein